MNYTNKNHILYAGLTQSINRGTADILEENKQRNRRQSKSSKELSAIPILAPVPEE